ncbi:olfactory receptor 5J3-like [Emydura macquarii macquarii]|uniref:olfactory receptor 5J3-like n=1 Tax=Emydura macquarii macquarii TaxID=1129001 RepID=UPI00352B98FE
MNMENQTMVTEFILLGLSNDPHLQIFLFVVFLVIYAITLLGNMMIMLVISSDLQLHTPMYFFLFHLSFMDICYSSVTVPKMLQNFLTERKTISANGCFAQNFLFLLSGGTGVFILSAMAYDRYAAICNPLHYVGTMNKQVCCHLLCGSCISGFLYALANTVSVLSLHFCGPNEINHFSCEPPALLVLSCSETLTPRLVLLTSVIIFGSSSFLLTLVSYIYIISTILRIRSAKGRRKAFSTCSSHLMVVILYYGTGCFRYMKPAYEASDLDRIISIQYSILTPMLNPVIYSLKNKDVKTALWKLFGKFKFPKES